MKIRSPPAARVGGFILAAMPRQAVGIRVSGGGSSSFLAVMIMTTPRAAYIGFDARRPSTATMIIRSPVSAGPAFPRRLYAVLPHRLGVMRRSMPPIAAFIDDDGR